MLSLSNLNTANASYSLFVTIGFSIQQYLTEYVYSYRYDKEKDIAKGRYDSEYEKQPLHATYKKSDEKAVAPFEAGVNLNQPNVFGNTPLITACEKRNKEIITLLIEAKADLNGAKNSRNAPLITACKKRNKEIITLLVKAKADLNKGFFKQLFLYKDKRVLYFIAFYQ